MTVTLNTYVFLRVQVLHKQELITIRSVIMVCMMLNYVLTVINCCAGIGNHQITR